MAGTPEYDDARCVVSTTAANAAKRDVPDRGIPFALVHQTLGAVAAGELETAFDRLLTELRDWGIRRGALYVAEGELYRIAGEPVNPSVARKLKLYDGHDVVGELHLDVDGTESVELLELLQDVFGLGLGRRVRMAQLDLVRAAVAVNSAQSLDEALDVLAETCRRIAQATNAAVTVWEPDLSRGRIRAAVGEAFRLVGETIEPGSNVAYGAASTARATLMRGGRVDGLSESVSAYAEKFACAIGVPLIVEGAPPITFTIAWPEEPTPLAVERTITTVQRLGALTSVAFRAAEERVRVARSELLRGVIESVPDGMVISHGGEVTLNAAARSLFGLDEGRRTSGEEYNLRRLDGTPIAQEEWPSSVAQRTGTMQHDRLLIALNDEDRVYDFKAAPLDGGFVSVCRDVTDEHSEQVLTQEFLTRLFDSLPLAAAVADADTWTIRQVNSAFTELVGYDQEELLGTTQPFPWWDGSARLQRVPLDRPAEAVYRRKDGRPVPVDLLPFTVAGRDGAPARVVVLARDMTERREFDRQLIQSGKLAAIGELASGVAHEINNPLFAILGLVEFLLRDTEEGTKAHERLQLIQQTGLEIKEIVKALLDFARERTDEYRPLSLRDVVAETVELIHRTSAAKDVEIVERYASEPTPSVGSPNQIKQVLLNLFTNARHALADTGGTVTVEVWPDGEWVVASVTDDGPGIAPDVLQRIFEPFFTTKRNMGGTGLGLAVSHGIAEMHGGILAARSKPGEGATFELRIPRVSEESDR